MGQNWPLAGNSAPHSAQEASGGPAAGDVVTSGDGTACPHFRQNCEPPGRFAPLLPQTTAVSCGLFDRLRNIRNIMKGKVLCLRRAYSEIPGVSVPEAGLFCKGWESQLGIAVVS